MRLIPRRRKRAGRRRGLPALLIAAIAILIPVVFTYYAFEKRFPFQPRYVDYVVVPNAVHVRDGDPVRIAGIDVGAVTGVSADGLETKLAFTVSAQGRPIHTDATITIRDRLFLEGSYYLDLFPGSPDAPVAPQGFTIEPRNTATPVQFFQVLSTFDAAARTNLKDLLGTFNVAFSPPRGKPESDSGAGGFKRALGPMTQVLKDIALFSRAFQGSHAGDLERLLSSSSDITSTLASRSSELVGLLEGLNQTMGALASDDGHLAATVSGLDQTLRVAPPALTALNRSLGPLDRLADALTPVLRRSPRLVSQLTSSVDSVDAVVRPGQRQRLISSMRALLVGFPTTVGQIAKLFPSTLAVSQCLRERIVPLLEEQAQDGSLSSGEPVWKDFIHMLPNLAGASGNFDADGPYLRTLVGAGSSDFEDLGDAVPTLGKTVDKLFADVPGGGSTSVAPSWIGDLTPSDFHPNVACTSEPLPSLTSDPADADSGSSSTASTVKAAR